MTIIYIYTGCGIQNTSDFQIAEDWEKPYAGLNLQWFNILGNHEYGYNVQAQIDYANINSNWILDDRYYTRRILVDSATSTYMTIFVVDTSPCISSYRSNSQSGWDPCSTKYPTCSLGSTNDDFEGPCYFNQNILSQNCTAQYEWASAALDQVPVDDWLVIAGHHPSDEINVMDFTSLFQKRGFALYLNGHTHLLNLYSIDGANAYVTSGAGSLVNTVDQSFAMTTAKLKGDDIAVQKIKEMEIKESGESSMLHGEASSSSSHSYKSLWTSTTAGFTQHTFNSAFTLLTTEFVSYTGAVLYTFTVNKQGVIQ